MGAARNLPLFTLPVGGLSEEELQAKLLYTIQGLQDVGRKVFVLRYGTAMHFNAPLDDEREHLRRCWDRGDLALAPSDIPTFKGPGYPETESRRANYAERIPCYVSVADDHEWPGRNYWPLASQTLIETSCRTANQIGITDFAIGTGSEILLWASTPDRHRELEQKLSEDMLFFEYQDFTVLGRRLEAHIRVARQRFQLPDEYASLFPDLASFPFST